MRIAIIGSGISGLTCAYLLSKSHEVTVFDANSVLGGHTATKTITHGAKTYEIDTGFIVYNDWTYPNFIRLLKELDVKSKPTKMGFSVFKQNGSYHYAGNNLNALFAKRSLLVSAGHWILLRDIVRFNKQVVKAWKQGTLPISMTLGEYLDKNKYSVSFCDNYLIPMGAAIWSSSMRDMRDFPVQFFVEFFYNHGLLNLINRPVWRVIEGGSKNYIDPLCKPFANNIHLNEAVKEVLRTENGVELATKIKNYSFDHVVFAGHSNQVLEILGDATTPEQSILGSIKYKSNSVTLHWDEQWLPASKNAWASWNYCLDSDPNSLPVLTYNMNILQGIKADVNFCVTLNAYHKIDNRKVLGRYDYEHPVFTETALTAQKQWAKINTKVSSYCGAYWFNGFHEDGVNSAIRVAQNLGVDL